MKIHRLQRTTPTNPIAGVRFTLAEKSDATAQAITLAGLPPITVAVIKAALAREILRLEELADYTEGGNEVQRERELDAAMVTYLAVREVPAACAAVALEARATR